MAGTIEMTLGRDALDSMIRGVRNRWRLKVALHGLMILAGGVLVAVLAGSWVMDLFRFAPPAVASVRLAAYLLVAAIAALYLVGPLMRRVSDDRVALYLEEREPSLDSAVLTAVETTRRDAPAAARSPNLVARLVDGAVARASAIGNGARIEQRSLIGSAATIAAIILGGILLMGMGPGFLRHGARLLATPWDIAAAKRPYMISVEPGNAKVTRGGDVAIRAALQGFISEEVLLVLRRGADSTADSAAPASGQDVEWERLAMGPGRDSGDFELRLFDVRGNTSYYVESDGVRSPVFQLEVVELPYVAKLDLEYRYPAHTCLAVETVENAGDVAAPRGTSIIVHATTTKPVKGGRIVLEGHPPVPLTLGADGTLTGVIPVTAAGFYKIELEGPNGAMVPGSLDYTIDALEDHGPAIAFRKPGRDVHPSSVEEVFTEAEATDDYGVAKMAIRYSVNGGAEKVVSLYSSGGCRKEAVAGHTFFLEELGLQPGDLVAYYGQVTDNGGQVAKTDIYFFNIRPFDRQYQQGQQQQGGGGGGQQQQQKPKDPTLGELSRRQRDIIAGTFKVDRDKAELSAGALRENLAVLLTSQRKLREQADTLAQRLVQRGVVGTDSAFRIIAEELPKATAAMREAEGQLERQGMHAALAPEQRALQHLQRAEAAYREVKVPPQSQGGGGSSGEQQEQPPQAEDLADLFELKDQISNAVQTEQQSAPQTAQAAERVVDETAEKLKQLAARQQAENERRNRANAQQQRQQQQQQQRQQQQQGQQQQRQGQQQQGQQSQGQQSSRRQSARSGQSQRQLAEQTEQLLEQLEQAAAARPEDRELREGVRRLQEAVKAMRRAASDPNDRGAAQSAAALDALNEAQRLLAAQQQARGARAADAAVRHAERIATEQRAIEQTVKQAEAPGATPGADHEERLRERKDALVKDIGDLQSRLNELAREVQPTQPSAAGKLKATAEEIRQSGIQDRASYARALRRGGGAQGGFEEQLSEDTEKLRQKVAEAVKPLRSGGVGGPGAPEGQTQAEQLLGRARDLVQAIESLEERAQQPGGDARQLAREYGERREAAEGLQRDVRRQGLRETAGGLASTIEQIRALEDPGVYGDPAQLARLQAEALERLKQWEFSLRQRLVRQDLSRPQLGGTNDVPAEFRALVAEYYRSLAGKR